MPTTIMRPLRIVVVSETFPPEINGVAVTMGHFVRDLRARGHHIELIRPRQYRREVPAQQPGFEEILVKGVAIPRYDVVKIGMPVRQLLLRQWSWRRPDIVHIATEGPLGWSALMAARDLGLPVVTDFHTNFHTYSGHYGIGWLKRPITAYLRRFHNQAHCTLVPTDELRTELSKLGFENLFVVARGVDTRLFDPAKRDPVLREIWRAAPEDPVALYVGRMAPEKNLSLVIETFEAMYSVNARTKLVIVGDGPERQKLRLQYPRALYAGARIGEDLAAYYASADIFLFPSMTETYGNVTIEALVSGLAVVAYDYASAAQHIRHNDNGLVAKFGDRDAFVRLAIALANDPARIARLRARARASTEHLHWSRIVGEFEQVLLHFAQWSTHDELASRVLA